MKLILFSILLILPHSLWAANSWQLVKEYEILIRELPDNDPQKIVLVLRQADQLYDAMLENLTKDLNLEALQKVRAKAISLYEKVLSHPSANISVETKIRVQYQLARLLNENGQVAKAEALFLGLTKQSLQKRIQQEAALYLAEKKELSQNSSELKLAVKYYEMAAALPANKGLATYIYYRLGWTQYRVGLVDAAIASLQKSLNLADKDSIAQVLKDLSLFYSHSKQNPANAISHLKMYSAQFPRILDELADAYSVADNKAGYAYTLSYLASANYDPARQIRLIDTYYSLRDVKNLNQAFGLFLERVKSGNSKFRNTDETNEAEARLFRLTVELDTQAARNPQFLPLFENAADAYVWAFPKNENVLKVISGWCTRNETTAMAKLESWIPFLQRENPRIAVEAKRIGILLAVKAKRPQFVLAYGAEFQDRDSQYQKARALMQLNREQEAEPLFQSVIQLSAKPDKATLFSMNFLLEIYGKRKDYERVSSLVDQWTNNEQMIRWAQEDVQVKKEFIQFQALGKQAQFERAALADSQESKNYFLALCEKNEFLPKSCNNALVLARKSNDSETTLKILKIQKREFELADELEILGRFSESALVKESLAKDLKEKLRVALLFEIDGNFSERDRVLKKIANEKHSKLEAGMEDLLFNTFQEADLLLTAQNIPWSEKNRLTIKALSFQKNPKLEGSDKVLLKTCRNIGIGWQLAQLGKIRENSQAMGALGITGKNSERNFNRRVALLEAQNKQISCFMSGADSEKQSVVLDQLKKDFDALAEAVLSAPIPDGLAPEMKKEVEANIKQVAQPFLDKSALLTKQIETLSVARKLSVMDLISDLEKVPSSATTTLVSADWKNQLIKVKERPRNKESWVQLRDFFKSEKRERISAYITGRANSFQGSL